MSHRSQVVHDSNPRKEMMIIISIIEREREVIPSLKMIAVQEEELSVGWEGWSQHFTVSSHSLEAWVVVNTR